MKLLSRRSDRSSAPSAARRALLGSCAAVLMLAGCANAPQSTAVSRDSVLQAHEGVVVLRMVSLYDMPLTLMKVTADGQEAPMFELRAVSFGQTQSLTFVGRMPAGRYQPRQLFGVKGLEQLTVPLEKLTGKFEVEAARVTDLGTMVFVPTGTSVVGAAPAAAPGEVSGAVGGSAWNVRFALPLEATPVPVDALLSTRFPDLAKAMKGKSSLGWVAGSTPPQRADALDVARQRIAPVVSNPQRLADNRTYAGGALGTVAEYRKGGQALLRSTGAVQHIEATALLDDGRWLAGGEEGHVAVSEPGGQRWQRLPGLRVDEVVIHLSQAPDRNLYMVTMDDGGSTVYRSAAAPIAWTAIKRIAVARDVGTQWSGTHYRDFAAATRERLAVYTRPEVLTTLDFASGRWETTATPRTFGLGLKATADGLLIGTFNQAWVYRSVDYGKSWTRIESWVNASISSFLDRDRGFIVAGDVFNKDHRLRKTVDGGKTWTLHGPVAGSWQWGQPLWTDAAGDTLYTVRWGRIQASNDQGRTWQ